MKDKQHITVSYSIIKRWGLIYISLPLFCFFVGWLRWYYVIPACAATLLCLLFADDRFHMGKKRKITGDKAVEDDRHIRMPKWMPWCVIGISFLYCFFCGIGRLWAQSKDYPWRNAIFRDLILRDWPVQYPKFDGALVYYIGQWLPAALPGKIARSFGASDAVSFMIGNIALLVYVSLGIAILFFLLFMILKPGKKGAMILIILSFIFFSGMDIVASIEPLGANNYHLEWWARDYQYSSFTTCMCWVFNQAVIPWICMALLLNEKTIENYVLIGMACLLSGPFPFVGYFIFALASGVTKLIIAIRTKTAGRFFRNLFSLSNLLAAFFVFPFIGAYLLSNAAIAGGGAFGASNALTEVVSEVSVDPASAYTDSGEMIITTAISDEAVPASYPVWEAIWTYIKFILLEFGIYAILVARKYRKEPLFYVTIVSLLVFPFLRMGYSSDFTMRASIPAIYMMYVFCVKFLIEEKDVVLIDGEGVVAVTPVKRSDPADEDKDSNGGKTDGFRQMVVEQKESESGADAVLKQKNNKGWDIQKLKRYGYALLVVCMILGAATPLVEFIRGFRQVGMRGINDPVTDFLYTMGGDGPYSRESSGPELNFVALDLDNQVFFKYFSK